MYSVEHMARVQDFVLRHPRRSFYVIYNPRSPKPDLLGELKYRTSEYVQQGSILVLDIDGIHAELAERLALGPAADDEAFPTTQHGLFNADDLAGLAARESQ